MGSRIRDYCEIYAVMHKRSVSSINDFYHQTSRTNSVINILFDLLLLIIR